MSARYFLGPPSSGHFREHFPLLETHVIGGVIALLTGPWQFSVRLRQRSLKLHRWLGRIYLSAVAVGSTAGLVLAIFSMGGLPAHLGFGTLAVLWFATGLIAFRLARRGYIQAHRQWTIRNYSLTFAAVTLRNELPLLIFGLHWSFVSAYTAVSWLCWVPNLIFAEWLISRTGKRQVLIH